MSKQNKKTRNIIILVIAVVVAACGVVLMAGKQANTAEQKSQAVVQSKYLSLQYPVGLMNVLSHEQDEYEDRITDVFYMNHGEEKIPLFRFDFGDVNAGDWVGMLKMESGDVDVTSVVFLLTDEEYATLTEEEQKTYTDCMNAYYFMVEDIKKDSRFTNKKTLPIGEDAEVKTTYWTLMLPDNMTAVETQENETYIVTFYGEIAEESVALYTVHIGEDKVDTELGMFEIDGDKKPISVASFDLSEKVEWMEDDYATAYRMMDTINHVIETIMQSKQFSATAE